MSNAINDKPAISFNGTSSYMSIPDNPSLRPTNVTIIGVATREGGSDYGQIISKPYYNSSTWAAPYQAYGLWYDPSGLPYGVCAISGTEKYVNGSKVNTGQPYLLSATYDGTSVSLVQDGNANSATISGSIDNGDSTRKDLVIGAGSTNWPYQVLNGQIAEILIYNRALTSTERQQAEGYLADKYGLYDPNATWPLAYSSEVQEEIAANQWNQAQANAYVASETNYPDISSDGLVVHLDSSVGVTANGSGQVSQWADQSPYFNNANQGSSGNQPNLVASRSDLNGKPVIQFNGTSSYLDISDNASLKPTSAVTVIAIAQNNGAGQQDIVSHPLTSSYYGYWALAPAYSYDLGVQPYNVERGYIGTGALGAGGGTDLSGSSSLAPKMSVATMINGSTTQAECQRSGKTNPNAASWYLTATFKWVGFPLSIRTFRRKVPPPPNGCPHQPRKFLGYFTMPLLLTELETRLLPALFGSIKQKKPKRTL